MNTLPLHILTVEQLATLLQCADTTVRLIVDELQVSDIVVEATNEYSTVSLDLVNMSLLDVTGDITVNAQSIAIGEARDGGVR